MGTQVGYHRPLSPENGFPPLWKPIQGMMLGLLVVFACALLFFETSFTFRFFLAVSSHRLFRFFLLLLLSHTCYLLRLPYSVFIKLEAFSYFFIVKHTLALSPCRVVPLFLPSSTLL
ncbi:hypothetical protein BKA70DRAFT_1335790 [Coprinopsis sp. MPI-PUGE-AT-0042]|nr:hypothetical protein BKA70DRAFT_1335790 [Coprinopsis sp. MPI-PUGE-AT-0042]